MTAEWFLLLPINAAISSLVIPLKQKTEIRNLKSRHSRAGGNLGLSARKLIGKNGFFRFYVLDSRFCGNDDEKIVVASDKFLPCWVLDSRFCGNDGRVVSVAPDKCRHLKSRHSLKTENRNQKPKIPSFPRRRESRSVGTETYREKRFL
ncbi:fimbrial protein P9-2 precursor [Neisseria meningitidis]|nr:fimbrial protein P9-2 precursor [Neisseria meningitidis]CWP23869.1 fimbrial protein P9-2 precursor [Neisseria meningitidis]